MTELRSPLQATGHWTCADQNALRQAIPENRLRMYDVRAVIAAWWTRARLLALLASATHKEPPGTPYVDPW